MLLSLWINDVQPAVGGPHVARPHFICDPREFLKKSNLYSLIMMDSEQWFSERRTHG